MCAFARKLKRISFSCLCLTVLHVRRLVVLGGNTIASLGILLVRFLGLYTASVRRCGHAGSLQSTPFPWGGSVHHKLSHNVHIWVCLVIYRESTYIGMV